jgi:hypothetical protein
MRCKARSTKGPGRRFYQLLSGDIIIIASDSNLAACIETRQEMYDLFANGVVFFNHFLRLTHYPTVNTLQDAFARGAALFTPFNFPGCDLIIPVSNLSTKSYTFIIIQVKNRRNDSATPSLKNKAADDLGIAAQRLKFTSSAPLAHIAIMMCLRTARECGYTIYSSAKTKAGKIKAHNETEN